MNPLRNDHGTGRSTATPFLSELIEMKKNRNLEVENDYIEHPKTIGGHGGGGCSDIATDDDVIRRALSFAHSLPGRLDFDPQNRRSSPESTSAHAIARPPPIPPRPIKSLSCEDRGLISGSSVAANNRYHVGQSPMYNSREPPPRPPKSPDVIALMMNQQQFRASHPSLRDRRGDVIELSPPRHQQHRRHPRHSRPAPTNSPPVSNKHQQQSVVTSQPSRNKRKDVEEEIRIGPGVMMTTTVNEKSKLRRQHSDNDDMSREKERLKREDKIQFPTGDDDVAKGRMREEAMIMTSCPHCGKCLHDEKRHDDDEKKHRRGSDVEKASEADAMMGSRRDSSAGSRCECSMEKCIEFVTCISCVRCCFYHCVDDHNDENLWADKPCACHGVDCRLRWVYLVFLSICFPCILLYPILRTLTSLTSRSCNSPCCCCRHETSNHSNSSSPHHHHHRQRSPSSS